jgi:CheY-like chemotaxis protein
VPDDALAGCRALVVDDNATNRQILEEVLRLWRVDVTTAASGAEALDVIAASVDTGRPFQMLLVDVHMPGMDGFTLVGDAQRRFGIAGAAVLMLTSDRRPGDFARCQALGVAAHLIKPVRHDELRRALDGLLRTGGSAAVAPAVQPGVPGSAGRGLSVLVAEDNAVNQRLAAAMLARLGHRAVIVADGRQAVEAVSREAFDLVLMDVQMPEMSGLDAAAAIRRAEAGSDRRLPIVAMTAHAMQGDRDACIEAGMDDYITKPVSLASVEAALHRACAPLPRAADTRRSA